MAVKTQYRHEKEEEEDVHAESETPSRPVESIDKVLLSNGAGLPMILNSFGILFERGECNQLGDINFAVTYNEQDTNSVNTNSVKGAVI